PNLRMAVTPLVAIIGRPNVGKSSLFNRLIGSRQAITHETAGTTRDANYGAVTWNGKHFLLADTAGLHPGDHSELEMAVQSQIEEVAAVADVLVMVIDAGVMITQEDQLAARLARRSRKPLVLVVNKIDTASKGPAEDPQRLGIGPIIETSAIHG